MAGKRKEETNGQNEFEAWKDKVWEISQPQLTAWKKRIEEVVGSYGEVIDKYLEQLEIFYGEKAPHTIRVQLNYHPKDGAQKGEPITNFEENGLLPSNFADVLYWIGEPHWLPTDTKDDKEREYLEAAVRAVVSIMHEVEHQFFQKEDFLDLIGKAENDDRVKQSVTRIKKATESYMHPTNELLTTYLEAVLMGRMSENAGKGATDRFEIEISKEKVKRVFEMAVSEDVDRWKGKGPYSSLRLGWREKLGGLPEGYEETSQKTDRTRSKSGFNIYEIGRNLDPGLAREYLEAGKRLDVKFVVRMYRLVEGYMEVRKGGE